MITLTREEAEQIFNLFERLDNVFCITAKWHGNPQKGYVTTKIRDYSSVIIDLGNQVERNQVLRARLSEFERAECDGGQCGIGGYCKQCPKTQPEPEPVAWISDNAGLYHGKPPESLNSLPLYLTPPQREWAGLTDEEYEAMAEQHVTNCYFDTLKYAKAIQAKLKEKNYDKR